MVHKMTVDGSELFLDESQDVEQTKSEIVEAVQNGGGIVDVVVAGHTTVSVLFSQRIPVIFETIDCPEPEENRAAVRASSANDVDVDVWEWADLPV